jgi:hypothetical protein
VPKFAKGQPRAANAGRRKGTPNKASAHRRRLLEAINADDKVILDRIIAEAKAGDPNARNLYLRHICPQRRPETFLDPADYKTPETVEEARETILKLGERLIKGDISLETHDALVAGLRAYLGDKAVGQERLLTKLENDLREGEGDA